MRLPISPALRWVLANLMLHRGLTLNGGIPQDVAYNRTRVAFGLRGPMSVILRGPGTEASPDLVSNSDATAYAEISEEIRDFLITTIFPLPKHPYQSLVLSDLTDSLINWKTQISTPNELETARLPSVKDLTENWIVNATPEKEPNARPDQDPNPRAA